MEIIYARESFPTAGGSSIFLAGPTPRDPEIPSWRPSALAILAQLGFEGHVFVPEDRNGRWDHVTYEDQVEWEEKALNRADVIVFWVPREMKTLPALTTNVEWGVWGDSGKVVIGRPSEAAHMGYLTYYARKYKVPLSSTLRDTLLNALSELTRLGEGKRTGGELSVPLCVWKHPSFQSWYKAQVGAGNRLEDSKVLATFWVGPERKFLFGFVLWADVYISAEDRHKTNEFFFARPDISTIVLHGPVHRGDLGSTEIVLIREFRTPANNPTGFVWECPGGSSFKPNKSPLQIASEEVKEETGMGLDPSRFSFGGTRQLVSTLSVHRAHLYTAEVTARELEWFRANAKIPRGVLEDTERTYVEIKTLREILDEDFVDWSMLGMIQASILKAGDLL